MKQLIAAGLAVLELVGCGEKKVEPNYELVRPPAPKVDVQVKWACMKVASDQLDEFDGGIEKVDPLLWKVRSGVELEIREACEREFLETGKLPQN